MKSFIGRPLLFASLVLAPLSTFVGCEEEPPLDCASCTCCHVDGGAGGGGGDADGGSGGAGGGQVGSGKLDILFVVDNSTGMQAHQELLAGAADRLFETFENPPCLTESGAFAEQPSAGTDACPEGSSRAYAPVRDIHLGVISSSLGSLVGGACDTGEPGRNDGAHLLDRSPSGDAVPTYESAGFLAYDPDQVSDPPGEADRAKITDALAALIGGAGQTGCGYEMPLEAMTRFLVDPAPYASLEQSGDDLTEVGLDQALLDERAAFVRPDSALVIVLLSSENDCSIDIRTSGHQALESAPMPRATSACAGDPDDPCCTSCASPIPAGCAPDAACGPNQGTPAAAHYSPAEDNANLRCYAQKQRYGVDYLYPTDRYVNALSATMIDRTTSDLGGAAEENPLFAGGRDPASVVLLTLVGVPWPDLAADPMSSTGPQLSNQELEDSGRWAWMVEGEDPFMLESVAPRSGEHPGAGFVVNQDNPINGGDTPANEGKLQMACGQPDSVSGCNSSNCRGAEPGLRHLEVVRALGASGVPGSICSTDPDAAFAPAFRELSRRVAPAL
ncbi:MAG: hypothetical protein JNK04_20480 [Myxococcales bacterium]|nr:hypothetical protein [Myxococcales bacterium]